MKKNIIVFVYHALNIGGAEKELIAYLFHLNPAHFDVHIILTQKTGELLHLIPLYVKIHEVPGNSTIPNFIHIFNLYNTLKTIKPDVVIGFMQDICFNILLVKRIWRQNYKVIISEQVVLSQWQKVKNTSFIKRLLIKILYRGADTIFVQSESIMEDLIKNFGIHKNKLFFIPSFISLKEINNRSKEILPGKIYPFFLYVGRTDPEKNIETLLQAFMLTSQKFPAIQLVIVGSHQTSYYDNICLQLGIHNSVHFVGYVDMPSNYYHHALALVIPSSVEGRSRVMIEAMALNCPVISADFTGYQKYIKNMQTGLVFHQKSVKKLYICLNFCLKYPKIMRKIAHNAHTYIMKTHFNVHIKNYDIIFNSALNKVLNA